MGAKPHVFSPKVLFASSMWPKSECSSASPVGWGTALRGTSPTLDGCVGIVHNGVAFCRGCAMKAEETWSSAAHAANGKSELKCIIILRFEEQKRRHYQEIGCASKFYSGNSGLHHLSLCSGHAEPNGGLRSESAKRAPRVPMMSAAKNAMLKWFQR